MISEAQKRATATYKRANYRKLTVEMPKAEYEAFEKYIALNGLKKAEFIRRIIRENIQ